ncbi:MAG: type III-B CRISPR module-associated protein Cmr5 [Candidatus Bathyarchaeia archaeon]
MVREPTRAAVEDMKVITSLIGENKRLGGKFRTRTRSLPSLINEVGIVPTLSFCYGKAGEKIYGQVENHFYKIEKIEEGNEEEVGYALYLFIALNYLKELGLIDQTERVIEALDQLFGKCEIASKLLRPYLLQVKRLAEALFEPEREST